MLRDSTASHTLAPMHHLIPARRDLLICLKLVSCRGLTTLTPVLAALSLAGAHVVLAQESFVIRDGPRCLDCTIAIRRMVELRAPQGEPRWTGPRIVATDSLGRLFVADPLGAHVVYVFDSLGRSIGQLRTAGGEALTPIRAISSGPGGTVHVWHRHRSIFSERLTFIRSDTATDLPRPFSSVVLADGRTLMQGLVRNEELFGRLYHLVGADGRRVRSFGEQGDRAVTVGSWSTVRSVSAADTDRFWAAHRNNYQLELWTLTGEPVQRIRRIADWFPAWEEWDSRLDRAPPPTRLMGVAQDAAGRVWTLSLVPKAGAKPLVRNSTPGSAPAFPTAAEWERIDDSMIEVIDVQRGLLLASTRVPFPISGFLTSNLVARSVPRGTADVAVVVYQLSLIKESRK